MGVYLSCFIPADLLKNAIIVVGEVSMAIDLEQRSVVLGSILYHFSNCSPCTEEIGINCTPSQVNRLCSMFMAVLFKVVD